MGLRDRGSTGGPCPDRWLGQSRGWSGSGPLTVSDAGEQELCAGRGAECWASDPRNGGIPPLLGGQPASGNKKSRDNPFMTEGSRGDT